MGGDKNLWRIPCPDATFPGDATLRFRSLDKDSDVGKYNGHQYPWIGFDELTEFSSAGPYLFMIKCCRSAVGAPAYIRSTGNPGRPGHPWVKPRFIDVIHPYKILKYFPDPLNNPDRFLTRCFIPSQLENNQLLMLKDPDYELRLMTDPDPRMREALRYGNWDIDMGEVFKFTRERNVIPRRVLGPEWFRWTAMDWGFRKPFSIGWYAGNRDGRVIRYREFYGCEPGKENVGLRMSARDVAARAWQMGLDEGVTMMIADPACWSKNDDMPSISEQFESAGFEMIKANNDRINGIQAVHSLIDQTGEDGKSYFLVTDNCTQWLRTVPYMRADPKRPEDVDTTQEDHAYDEFRYSIYSDIARDPAAYIREGRNTTRRKTSQYNPITHGLKRG